MNEPNAEPVLKVTATADDVKKLTEGNQGEFVRIDPPPTPSALVILHRAAERGASPEQLDRFLSLVERCEAAEAAEAFADALAGFQRDMPPVAKGRAVANKGGGTRYKFAGYEDVMLVAGPVLAKHGISLTFSEDVTEEVKGTGEVVTKIVMTMRVRVGKHFEDKTVCAPVPNVPQIAQGMGMNEPQAFGLVLSYFKRYCLVGGLNLVVADEDSDAAFGLGAAEVSELWRLILDCERAGKPADLPRLLNWFGAPAVEKIPRARFDEAVKALTAKLHSKAEGVAK